MSPSRCPLKSKAAVSHTHSADSPLGIRSTFFKAWLGIGIAWGGCSAFLLVIYPIIEGRHELAQLYRGMLGRA